MRSLLSLALALGVGCAGDPPSPDEPMQPDDPEDPITVEPDACDDSFLTYENFGEPFVLDWCRGCHSSALPDNMRQASPEGINFDTLADVQEWRDRIAIRAAAIDATMPPAGGPTLEEREMLAEWIACGAK